jgi:hypothetical protein
MTAYSKKQGIILGTYGQRTPKEDRKLQFARSEQFVALPSLNWPVFGFLEAKSCLFEASLALSGHTIPPAKYCIATYAVP